MKESRDGSKVPNVSVLVCFCLSISKGALASRAAYDPRLSCGVGDPFFCASWMPAAGTVETACRFRVRAGLRVPPSTVGPALFVNVNDNELELEPGGDDANATRRFEETTTPAICFDDDVSVRDDGPLLLLVANEVRYLFRLWPYFVNKVFWARSVGLRTALWIGELPGTLAQTVSGDCQESALMRAKKKRPKQAEGRRRRLGSSYYAKHGRHDVNSNHYIKMMAASALLQMMDTVPGLFYLDLDTYAPASAFGNLTRAAALRRIHDDDEVDVLFGNPGSPDLFWHVKGSEFYLRNSALGRRFVAAWLHFRCGFKDQYALWHAILTLASSSSSLRGGGDHDAPRCLDYHGDIWAEPYKDSQVADDAFLRAHPALRLSCAQRLATCPAFRFCQDQRYDLRSAGLPHSGIVGSATRSYRYGDDDDAKTIVVQDMLATKRITGPAYKEDDGHTLLEFLSLL
mmetsp:Transcript_16168/g.52620  ORF Transcript_16168/g.52620 Transcript_16168/m.52620 type:complete len:458 (+) Transcript_16168:33-1406(+)